MKKIFESIYLFSKLTTSIVLFAALIIMGYFFYTSYKNQDKAYLEKIQTKAHFVEFFRQLHNIVNIKLNKKTMTTILKNIFQSHVQHHSTKVISDAQN